MQTNVQHVRPQPSSSQQPPSLAQNGEVGLVTTPQTPWLAPSWRQSADSMQLLPASYAAKLCNVSSLGGRGSSGQPGSWQHRPQPSSTTAQPPQTPNSGFELPRRCQPQPRHVQQHVVYIQTGMEGGIVGQVIDPGIQI